MPMYWLCSGEGVAQARRLKAEAILRPTAAVGAPLTPLQTTTHWQTEVRDDQFHYDMEQELQVQHWGHRAEEFGAGGEEGEAEAMRMGGGETGGS